MARGRPSRLSVTMSVTMSGHAEPEERIEAVDEALWRAKQGGRNRVRNPNQIVKRLPGTTEPVNKNETVGS